MRYFIVSILFIFSSNAYAQSVSTSQVINYAVLERPMNIVDIPHMMTYVVLEDQMDIISTPHTINYVVLEDILKIQYPSILISQ
ncbi:MAG: hypothetical protein ACI9TY_000591 [Alphaproteobacteria bacterium]|jgi:hypothetical protein